MKGDTSRVKTEMSRKGQVALSQAPAAVVILVVIAVVIGVGQNILDKVDDTQTANSFAINSTIEGEKGLDTFSDFQTTMATIVVAVIIIGLLLGGFALVMGKRG